MDAFLVCIIIPVVLYGYLYAVEIGGKYFFISVEIFVLIITVIIQYVYSNFIAPCFNRFEEIPQNGELYQKVSKLAKKIKFPLTKIYTIDGSKRSNHSNAYFFGFWKNKRIVLYDTLIQ